MPTTEPIRLQTPAIDAPLERWAELAWSDEHLIAVAKPPGLPTHRVEVGGDGVVERLQAALGGSLGVHQRLDRDTSGVLVFARSPEGNRALHQVFAQRRVTKRYLAWVVGVPPAGTIDLPLGERDSSTGRVAVGSRSRGNPARNTGLRNAETRLGEPHRAGPWSRLEVVPVTGRQHQIRAHLAAVGHPVLGDRLYGGGKAASRMWLHATSLEFSVPWRVEPLRIEADAGVELLAPQTGPDDFGALLDDVILGLGDTDVARLGTPAETGLPGLKVDRYGPLVAVRWYESDTGHGWTPERLTRLGEGLRMRLVGVETVVSKIHGQHGPGRVDREERVLAGTEPPDEHVVEEHGVRYLVAIDDGLGAYLYLDQAENRALAMARLSERDEPSMLNLFAYTCSFSAAAAVAGARTTSVDISRKALAIGRRNIELNVDDPSGHRFFSDDALEALARLARRGEAFDLVVCDPPAFARRGKRTFSVERDLDALTEACLRVVAPGGWLLLCVNHRGVDLAAIHDAVARAGERIARAGGGGESLARVDAEVTEDGHAPLGVGTDLKSVWIRRVGPGDDAN